MTAQNQRPAEPEASHSRSSQEPEPGFLLAGILTAATWRQLGESPVTAAGEASAAAESPRRLRAGLLVRGQAFRRRQAGAQQLVLRGWARRRAAGNVAAAAADLGLAEWWGELTAHQPPRWADWDGCFSLAFCDAARSELKLYRNLMGSGFTYYVQRGPEFLCGSNLAQLVEVLWKIGWTPALNSARLPVFFIYRFVPGRETLVAGIQRLLPGELLEAGPEGHRVRQVQTWADLPDKPVAPREALAVFTATMGEVLRDCAAASPRAANTLSGGIDSTYLQARWNEICREQGAVPPSFGIHVPHPKTAGDTEYAQTAADALGSQHRLVTVDAPYPHYLEQFIRVSGEPPNHVQTAYFAELATGMAAAGYPFALCGEGADSLFGMGTTSEIQTAQAVRRWVPFSLARHGLAAAARAVGRRRLASYIALADSIQSADRQALYLRDVACYTEWSLVEQCFGRAALAAAIEYRAQLLEQYRVPPEFLQRLHAIGFLGEAIDSAALWTTVFNAAGGDLFSPFLDSRLVRFALSLPPQVRFPFRRPKGLLRAALQQYVPRSLVERRKRGFGQPVMEWLGPGGALRPWVERLRPHNFIDAKLLTTAQRQPNWFLSSLVCYDIWYENLLRSPG